MTTTTWDQRTLKQAFWILGGLMFLAGLPGWYDRFAHGHLNANYGSIVTWGLAVAVYIYFIGLSAGSFLLSSLVYVFNVKRFEPIGRLAVFTSILTLILALISISVDLGHTGRAWHVLAYANFKSPMAWMIWLYAAYFLLLVVEFWCLLRRDLVARSRKGGLGGTCSRWLALGSTDLSDAAALRDRRVVRVLAAIGVPVAIMFHGGVGTLFGVVSARPHWHTGMFPILFLLSALVSGGALLTVVTAVFQQGLTRHRDTVLALGQLTLGLLLLDVLFQLSEMLIAFRGGIPGHIAGLLLVVSGPYWWVFWGWQVLIGTILPILLLVLATRKDPQWVALAGLAIATGLFGMRLNIVIPGLAVEEIKGLADAVATIRTNPAYFPSLVEWLLAAGVVGVGLLLFGVADLLLPQEQEGHHVRA